MPTTTNIREAAAVLGALVLAAPLPAIAQTGAQDARFQVAVEHYRAGRYAAAYGRFVNLANAGDTDAAHIALFMHKYGPTLYGAWWDADSNDLVQWSARIRDREGRLQPVYVPGNAAAPANRAVVLKQGAAPRAADR